MTFSLLSKLGFTLVGILVAKTAEYAMGKIPHAYRERSTNSIGVQSMMFLVENNCSDFLQKTVAA
jgi:hypothetical protein